MAKIIKHGKYYNKYTNTVEFVIDVNCPECNEKISIYKKDATILPCICENCGCEFICEEKDIMEKDNEE